MTENIEKKEIQKESEIPNEKIEDLQKKSFPKQKCVN